jgi:uncharacterized protein YrzB (UPF0473 family)
VKNLVSAAAEEEEAPVVEETPALDGSDKVKVDDGNTVSVEGIPTNAELSIGEPTKKSLRAITKAAEADNMDPSNSLFAYDISIVDENGDESLFTIDDDEEFDRVADFFDDMFSTIDFDAED